MARSKEDERILALRPELKVFEPLFDLFSVAGERKESIRALSNCSTNDIAFINRVYEQSISAEEFEIGFKALDSEFGVAKAILELTSEIAKSKNSLFLELCVRIINRDDVVAWIEEDGWNFSDVRLMSNKLLTGSQVTRLWNGVILKRWRGNTGFGHPELLRAIPRNQNTPCEILEDIYKEDVEAARFLIAKNKQIDKKMTYLFLTSKRQKEREALASSRYVSTEILLYLTQDKSQLVQNAAKIEYKRRHKKIPDMDAQTLLQAREHVESEYLNAFPEKSDGKTEDDLLKEYKNNPDSWRTIAQHPALGNRAIKQFFIDGLDIFETDYFRNQFQKNTRNLLKLLPINEGLYELSSKTKHHLILVACIIKLQLDEELDEQLLNSLSFNSTIKMSGVIPLLSAHANIWQYCTRYYEAEPPERISILIKRTAQ